VEKILESMKKYSALISKSANLAVTAMARMAERKSLEQKNDMFHLTYCSTSACLWKMGGRMCMKGQNKYFDPVLTLLR
jgi:hypothetical protein